MVQFFFGSLRTKSEPIGEEQTRTRRMIPTTDRTEFLLNVKKILAVINTTYAVAKRKPEKIRLKKSFRSSNI